MAIPLLPLHRELINNVSFFPFSLLNPYLRILKDWTVIDRLHLVRVPTFVINGRKDIAQDYVVQPFFDKIEKVKWVTFENSSHTPFVEEQDKYMKLAADFLKA